MEKNWVELKVDWWELLKADEKADEKVVEKVFETVGKWDDEQAV
jgi:hypothetical protein